MQRSNHHLPGFFKPSSPASLIAKIKALPYYLASYERIKELKNMDESGKHHSLKNWQLISPKLRKYKKLDDSPLATFYEIARVNKGLYYQGKVVDGFSLRVGNKPECSFVFYPATSDTVLIEPADQAKVNALF